jgi:predicted transcriptional regulator
MTKKAAMTTAIPIRLQPHVKRDVKRLAQKKQLSEQAVMRLAIEHGIPLLEKLLEKPVEAAA